MTNFTFMRLEKPLLLLWVAINLTIGTLTVQQHGMSIDEPNNYRYAADTLDAYPSLFGTLYEPKYNSSYDGHGPAFVTIVTILVRAVQGIFPDVLAVDIQHFAYFITFQIGGLCLYWLAKRWFNHWTAWAILLLFITQPVLWGHAFINPKDIPFMTFFIASIAIGFAMVDGIMSTGPQAQPGRESGTSNNHAGTSLWRALASQVVTGFSTRSVWLAGILLGLTTSIRILGPYAGAIVGLYALHKSVRRTPGVLVAYLVIAAMACFLTWPFLWADPIAGFLHGFKVSSEYPWQGSVLFDGKVIDAADLPRRYLPRMISIQFTETAIVLFMVGPILAVWKMFKDKTLVPAILPFIWFIIPLAIIIWMRSLVYDGFRQILFLTPALFIWAGFALDQAFIRIRSVFLRLSILVLVAVPGAYSIVKLHPYEYIYYNSFVGGVAGAYERYELDYWATSYRETALFVNEIAPQNAHVVVFGAPEVYALYSRPEIKLSDRKDARKLMQENENILFDYVVMLNRRKVVTYKCKDADILKTVEREGAILVVVKKIEPGQDDCP